MTNEDSLQLASDWWKPERPGKCWVCRKDTVWAYLDIAYQHKDCEMWPNEDGTDTVIIGGRSD